MENTVGISLAGYSFRVEPAAYQRLRAYIDELIATFGTSPEGRDVVDSIEERLAELLSERVEGASVVMLSDVAIVIAQMGDVGEMSGEPAPQPTDTPRPRRRTRFYRDTEHRFLGGVCAGLTARMGIPSWVLRLLFLLTLPLGGFSLLLYVILWLALPPAVTAKERMEMRGQRLTFAGLRDEASKQYQSMRKAYREGRRASPSLTGGPTIVERVLVLFATVLLGIIRIVLFAVGVCLLVGGLLGMMGCILGFIFYMKGDVLTSSMLHDEFEWISQFMGAPHLVVILTMLIVLVPLGFAFIGGLSLVARVRIRLVPCLVAAGLWLTAIVALIAWSLFGFMAITPANHRMPAQQLEVQAGDTLRVQSDALFRADSEWHYHGRQSWVGCLFDLGEWLSRPANQRLNVELHITHEPHATLQVVNCAVRRQKALAHDAARAIIYEPRAKGDTLYLPSSFDVNQDWRPSGLETVDVHLYLPEGSYLCIDKNAAPLFNFAFYMCGVRTKFADQYLRICDGYLELPNGKRRLRLGRGPDWNKPDPEDD